MESDEQLDQLQQDQEASDKRLPFQAEALMRIMMRYRGRNAYCWPAQKALADEMGISEGRVRHWIAYLRDADMIEIQRTQTTNRYWIPPRSPPLENERSDRSKTNGRTARKRTVGPLENERSDRSKTNGREAAPIYEFNSSANSPKIQQQAAADCAAPTIEATIQSLSELGMPDNAKPFAKADHTLARIVLAHCMERFTHPRLKTIVNRAGYLLACLRNPFKFGFVRDNGEWKEPIDRIKANAAKRADARKQEADKREADRLEAIKQMAIHARNIERWESLPEESKERIRKLVRARFPLFAAKDDEYYPFKSSCIRMMEEGS